MRHPAPDTPAPALPGLVLLLALACAGEPSGPGARLIGGRLHAPEGAELSILRATWRGRDGDEWSGAVAADGRFTIEIPREEAEGELALLDPSGALHPFLFPFSAAEATDLSIVMVPRRWTIRAGLHQGREVATPLDPAVEDDADQLLYSYFFGQPHPRPAPTAYRLDLMTWPMEALPARVAFDHAAGSPVSASDSAAIWEVLDRMEAVLGLDLFQPTPADPDWWSDLPDGDPGHIRGVIRVVHDPPRWLGLPLGSGTPDVWEAELGEWARPGRFSALRVGRQELDGGVLGIGSLEPLRLADGPIRWPTVLMHEMLHVLGVGHTCRLPSPQGPCMRTAEPSPQDVAYMELLREVVRLERQHDTRLGILPAIIGERRLLLGRSALPALTGPDR